MMPSIQSLFFCTLMSLASVRSVLAQDCFNSTGAMLQAQALDTRPNDERKVYSFCPGLTIPIGIPTDFTFANYANGDFPLGVLRPNTTIEGNGVVFVGGVNQFGTLPVFQISGLTFADPKEGTILKDIVFDGTGVVPLGGGSAQGIIAAGPGDYTVSNVVFKNFNFGEGDLECISRPLYIGESTIPGLSELTPPGSIEFTLENVTFSDCSKDCSSLVLAANQTFNLKNAVFERINAAAAVALRGPFTEFVGENICVLDSTFERSALFQNELGEENVFEGAISGFYVDEDTTYVDCDEGENVRIKEGNYTCDSVPVVDACFNAEVVVEDSMMPSVMPSMMPSMGMMMADDPTNSPTSTVPDDSPDDSSSNKSFVLMQWILVVAGALVVSML